MGYISEALSFEGFGEDIHTQIAKLNVVIKSNLKFNPPNVLALHSGLFGKPLHLKKKTSPMTYDSNIDSFHKRQYPYEIFIKMHILFKTQ